MTEVFASFTSQLTREISQLSIHTEAGKDRYARIKLEKRIHNAYVDM